VNVLLDECIDRGLAAHLRNHHVKTVPRMGWAGIKNGRLLALAEKDFDVFVTVDRNLSYQQHVADYDIAVLVIRARSNNLRDLLVFVPAILSALPACKPGQVKLIQ